MKRRPGSRKPQTNERYAQTTSRRIGIKSRTMWHASRTAGKQMLMLKKSSPEFYAGYVIIDRHGKSNFTPTPAPQTATQR
jgi:hypothetical protein